jgi:N-acetylglucosamine-6-phosphate deacetylase
MRQWQPLMRRLLIGARLFTSRETLDGHGVLLDGEVILDILPESRGRGAETMRLPEGSILAPGFIDTQVNGGGGVLFNETPTEAAIRTIVAAHRRFGTTALLPTFITDAEDKMRAAARAAAAVARIPGSGVIGLHLEGPFLNVERRGVHSADFIRPLEAIDLDYLCGLPADFPNGQVLLSLAPETVEDHAIHRLSAAGVVVAGAHSAASYERAIEAARHGLRGFTHLFNAMPPLGNREPGIALAAMTAMTAPQTWCGVIVDGIHVHPAMLGLALRAKPPGHVFLVTDAMPPLGTDATSFTLYGETIHRRAGRLVTDDGRLAGADLDMAAAVRNCVTLLGLDLDEALRMASLYPATFLGLADRRGRIAPGYLADLTLLNADLQVLSTWVQGNWQAAV